MWVTAKSTWQKNQTYEPARMDNREYRGLEYLSVYWNATVLGLFSLTTAS